MKTKNFFSDFPLETFGLLCLVFAMLTTGIMIVKETLYLLQGQYNVPEVVRWMNVAGAVGLLGMLLNAAYIFKTAVANIEKGGWLAFRTLWILIFIIGLVLIWGASALRPTEYSLWKEIVINAYWGGVLIALCGGVLCGLTYVAQGIFIIFRK